MLTNLTYTYLLNKCYVSGTFLSIENTIVNDLGGKRVNKFYIS